MNKINVLKNIFLCVVIITSLTNCSKDDSTNEGSNSGTSRMTLKLNNIDYKEDAGTFNGNAYNTLAWDKTENTDGTFTYHIRGVIVGTNNFAYAETIEFYLGPSVKINQVYEANSNNFGVYIDFLDKNYSDGYSETTGQLKITYFDGKTMSGEFHFEKLKSQYVSSPYCNASSAIFTHIPNDIDL